MPLLGPVPGVVVGTVLLVGGFVVGLAMLVRRDDRASILLAAAYLCLAFFILPTRVHERYLFPIFAFMPLLAILDRRYLAATLVLTVSTFVGLHAVLSTPFWATPNLEDFFFGPAFRSYPVFLVCIVLTTGVFLFLLWRVLRATVEPAAPLAPDPLLAAALSDGGEASTPEPSRASSAAPPIVAMGAVTDAPWLEEVRPRALPEDDRRRTASSASAGASAAVVRHDSSGTASPTDGHPESLPRESAPGLLVGLSALVRRQVGTRLRRRDRSAELIGERPGRIDRLDVTVALLLLLAALTLRGWRVEEPYDMYFDEVYHARTATEFLQHWRYDEPPTQIYEYTHPHLAKYLMAVGIVLFGDDRVSATAQLGYTPRDAAVETRWDGVGTRPGRAGDRIYVSGEGGVRAYDLVTRELVAEARPRGGRRARHAARGRHQPPAPHRRPDGRPVVLRDAGPRRRPGR